MDMTLPVNTSKDNQTEGPTRWAMSNTSQSSPFVRGNRAICRATKQIHWTNINKQAISNVPTMNEKLCGGTNNQTKKRVCSRISQSKRMRLHNWFVYIYNIHIFTGKACRQTSGKGSHNKNKLSGVKLAYAGWWYRSIRWVWSERDLLAESDMERSCWPLVRVAIATASREETRGDRRARGSWRLPEFTRCAHPWCCGRRGRSGSGVRARRRPLQPSPMSALPVPATTARQQLFSLADGPVGLKYKASPKDLIEINRLYLFEKKKE